MTVNYSSDRSDAFGAFRRVLLRWDGSRQPVVWIAPPPDMFHRCTDAQRKRQESSNC